MLNLPEEIITIILSRLPAKSLLRFRCVSKSWCCLISDSSFAKLHLAHATLNNEPNLMLWGDYHTYTVNQITPSPQALEISNPNIFFSPNSFLSSTSCDGLLWIYTHDADVIWNPSTKQSKKLPPSGPYGMGVPVRDQEGNVCHGFGYDSSNDEYKLIRIIQLSDVCEEDYSSEVFVYSLRMNSWYQIEDPGSYDYNFIDDEPSEFVNGTCYWLAKPHYSADVFIVSFDIKDEKFREVPHPNCVNCVTCLGVLRGNLCVLEQFNTTITAELWLRKDFGVKEEWSKLFTISIGGIDRIDFSRVLCFSNDGNVLLDTENGLLLYDPRLDEAQIVRPRGTREEFFYTMPYVESLISLETNTHMEEDGA